MSKPPQASDQPKRAGRSKRRPVRDGLTNAERERPLAKSEALIQLETKAAAAEPDQLELFLPGPGGRFTSVLGGMPPLQKGASLDLARAWYRRELEQARR